MNIYCCSSSLLVFFPCVGPVLSCTSSPTSSHVIKYLNAVISKTTFTQLSSLYLCSHDCAAHAVRQDVVHENGGLHGQRAAFSLQPVRAALPPALGTGRRRLVGRAIVTAAGPTAETAAELEAKIPGWRYGRGFWWCVVEFLEKNVSVLSLYFCDEFFLYLYS
jgi:hypothetical protein